MKPTRVDYCQFLLSTQMNFTLTHHADHHLHFSHDALNRYLRGERLTSRLIFESVRSHIAFSPNGYLVFDDSVLDKNFSTQIELVRRLRHTPDDRELLYTAHQTINGIAAGLRNSG